MIVIGARNIVGHTQSRAFVSNRNSFSATTNWDGGEKIIRAIPIFTRRETGLVAISSHTTRYRDIQERDIADTDIFTHNEISSDSHTAGYRDLQHDEILP